MVAALVLAPAAIAMAYAGGWLWALLVVLASVGLYTEWLAIVGEGRQIHAVAVGVAALAIAGVLLALDRIEIALVVLLPGLLAVALVTPERRIWAATGFGYAAAAELASILLRRDPEAGFTALMLVLLVVGDRYRRLFCRARHRWSKAVAASQP